MCLLQWGPILDVLAAVGAHSRCACCNGGPILFLHIMMRGHTMALYFVGELLNFSCGNFQTCSSRINLKAKHPVCLAIDVVSELFLPKVTLQCHPKVTC